MKRILIVVREPTKIKELNMKLNLEGFACITAEDTGNLINKIIKQNIDLTLIDLAILLDSSSNELIRGQIKKIQPKKQLTIIALIPRNMLHKVESAPDIDDFVVEPYDLSELVIRINRIIKSTDELINGDEIIRCGDLLIDTAKCEVYLEGRILSLTFKEYELLKFLATNKGRVFSRDVLLNEVWGYDYYGGDRTVDVHIRRLRSKIEDINHSFIDTVRNIGYIFRDCNWSQSLEITNISNYKITTSNLSSS